MVKTATGNRNSNNYMLKPRHAEEHLIIFSSRRPHHLGKHLGKVVWSSASATTSSDGVVFCTMSQNLNHLNLVS